MLGVIERRRVFAIFESHSGHTLSLLTFYLADGMRGDNSCKDFANGGTFPVFSHVKGAVLDGKFGLGTDTHGSHYGGVKVGYRHWILDSD